MNDNCDPDKILRAADILIAGYSSPQEALAKARRVEEATRNEAFARLVREEIERRCLDRGLGPH